MLYEGAREEFFIGLGLGVTHRMSIGWKYALLTTRERRKVLFSSSLEFAGRYMRALQIVRGWVLGRDLIENVAEVDTTGARSACPHAYAPDRRPAPS